MVPTFLYYLRVLFPVLGGPNSCERICAGDAMSERRAQHSSQRHDSGSGCLDLVSCDRTRDSEASRD